MIFFLGALRINLCMLGFFHYYFFRNIIRESNKIFFQEYHQSVKQFPIIKTLVSIIRKYYNHILQINPGHGEEEPQNIYSN